MTHFDFFVGISNRNRHRQRCVRFASRLDVTLRRGPNVMWRSNPSPIQSRTNWCPRMREPEISPSKRYLLLTLLINGNRPPVDRQNPENRNHYDTDRKQSVELTYGRPPNTPSEFSKVNRLLRDHSLRRGNWKASKMFSYPDHTKRSVVLVCHQNQFWLDPKVIADSRWGHGALFDFRFERPSRHPPPTKRPVSRDNFHCKLTTNESTRQIRLYQSIFRLTTLFCRYETKCGYTCLCLCNRLRRNVTVFLNSIRLDHQDIIAHTGRLVYTGSRIHLSEFG